MAVRFMYRFMVYHMVFYCRCCVVAAAVVAHAMMVAVAGTKGYKAGNGEAYFDELVHI